MCGRVAGLVAVRGASTDTGTTHVSTAGRDGTCGFNVFVCGCCNPVVPADQPAVKPAVGVARKADHHAARLVSARRRLVRLGKFVTFERKHPHARKFVV